MIDTIDQVETPGLFFSNCVSGAGSYTTEALYFWQNQSMPGTIIKKLREQKMLKQETVAKAMGISQAAYSKIENNITELTVKHCRILSKIFEVNVYEHLPEDFEISRPVKAKTTEE